MNDVGVLDVMEEGVYTVCTSSAYKNSWSRFSIALVEDKYVSGNVISYLFALGYFIYCVGLGTYSLYRFCKEITTNIAVRILITFIFTIIFWGLALIPAIIAVPLIALFLVFVYILFIVMGILMLI